jgi:hypothetical protein
LGGPRASFSFLIPEGIEIFDREKKSCDIHGPITRPDAWFDPQSDGKQPERGRRARRYVSNEIARLGDDLFQVSAEPATSRYVGGRHRSRSTLLLLCAESEVQARCVSKVVLAIIGRRPEVP